MGQVLHGCATTTEAVRRAIQHSQKSLRALAKHYGINQKTVAKWRKRSSIADLPTGPKEPKSTVLSVEDEAIIVAFRRYTLLPLDDCLYALQATLPHLTRSSLHRCLQRHGISRLPEVEGDKPDKRKFKTYPIGYFHVDIAEVRTEEGIRNEADEPCPSLIVVMPKKDAVIDDTWFTLGMRGTGSKDVVLENTFIPEHYAVPMIEAQMGTVPGVESPLYRLPIRPALATMLLGTIVGMADRGLQLFIDKTRGRRDVYTGAMKSDNAGVQRRVAEASVEISCAWALTQQNCDLLEDAMLHDPPMPAAKRAQVRWNAAYATELCRRACNRLFEGAGAGAAHDSHSMQIFFRDMNTASHHAMLDFDVNVEIQGKSLLGVKLDDAWV
jgi:hypothetical protein